MTQELVFKSDENVIKFCLQASLNIPLALHCYSGTGLEAFRGEGGLTSD